MASAHDHVERAGMMNFVGRKRANLGRRYFDQGDSSSLEGGEFDHESMSFLKGMHDRAHVAGSQPVFGQGDF